MIGISFFIEGKEFNFQRLSLPSLSLSLSRLPGDEPGMIEKKSLYQWEHSPCPEWYIEDPFDVKHNLSGRTSENGRKRIIEAMEKALEKLNNFDEKACFSLIVVPWLCPSAGHLPYRKNQKQLAPNSFRYLHIYIYIYVFIYIYIYIYINKYKYK